ncbi:MAG: CbiX/SirB N-terminal domain-containing protein [Bryobacteraceae bacterium]|nr:CbiX/SirB N-terminal domain-containing protein [Bryobacteraceae bacterium]
MTAIVVFAHGSSVESANEGVRRMSAEMAARGGFPLVETAFLEMGKPDLPGAVACMCAGGAKHILVVPFFLTLGIHLRRDLPGIVDELLRIHTGITIEVTDPLEGHPALVDVMVGRAKDALGKQTGQAR